MRHRTATAGSTTRLRPSLGPRTGAVTLPEGAVTGRVAGRERGHYGSPARATRGRAGDGHPDHGAVLRAGTGCPDRQQSTCSREPSRERAIAFDAYRGFGNMLNQAQLGLSAFHVAFTSLDAIVSKTALGLEYLHQGVTTGDMGAVAAWGLKHLAASPTAPLARIGPRHGGRPPQPFRGHRHPDGTGLEDPRRLSRSGERLARYARLGERGEGSRWPGTAGLLLLANSAPEKMMAALRKGEYGKATRALCAGAPCWRGPRSRSWSTSSRSRSWQVSSARWRRKCWRISRRMPPLGGIDGPPSRPHGITLTTAWGNSSTTTYFGTRRSKI